MYHYILILLFCMGCGSALVIKSNEQGKEILFGNSDISISGINKIERVGNFLGPVDFEYSDFYLSPPPRKDIQKFKIVTFFTFKDVILSFIPFYSSRTVSYQGQFDINR